MKKTFALIGVLALLACGCTRAVNSYTFNYPSFEKQAWTQTYPANRDTQSVKCVLQNEATGAVILYVEDPYYGPTAKDTAMAYRISMHQRDYKVADDIDKYESGTHRFASFTFTTPNGQSGKLIAVRHRDVSRTIVLIGRWLPANDRRASKDLDRLALELDIGQYAH